MNKLQGHITKVETSGSMSLVTIEVNPKTFLNVIVIETPQTASYLKEGNPINALFKETEVVVGLNQHHNSSLDNSINGKVLSIERGILLSRVVIVSDAGEIHAMLSSSAVDRMKLQVNLPVIAMIKFNEIMLAEQ